MADLLKSLTTIEEELAEVTAQLADPAVATDYQRLAALGRRRHELETIAAAGRKLRDLEREIIDTQTLFEGEDADLRELARVELEKLRAAREQAEQEFRLQLLPQDPNDERNVIVEIRAGTGGEESALFAADLFKMYQRYAESAGWRVDVMNSHETGIGGFKELIFGVEGAGAYSRLKYESGVHRVQRVPETESQGRIHTSAVTVAVLPEAEEVEVEIGPEDIRVDVFRSTGPGGQGVNTTDSAVRLTHLPTGLVVSCQDERSQIKNRAKAMKILQARLFQQAQEEAAAERADQRRSMVGSGDRSERIRTYNFPQGRVTDHRVGLTLYRLQGVLDGDLDEIVDVLAAADREKMLAAAEEEK
ncbi:MAG: peptide chain release factor 1 [Candidatus Coatesbacteria bacterium]|nr:MAG: peptide chain release factor 1 [Candidatus Coatesbacteria bacterium]